MAREAAGTGGRADPERRLAAFLARPGHEVRQRACPLQAAGRIGPGGRKGIRPMAERLGLGAHDRLHHFVPAGTRGAAPLPEEPDRKGDGLPGGEDAVPVVGDTALPGKGNASAGVAPEHAPAPGKQAYCRAVASLTRARGEVPAMVGLRLFLPGSRAGDAERMRRVGVPVGFTASPMRAAA